MQFCNASADQTGGLQIGTEPFAVLLIWALDCDEIDEVARRNDGLFIRLGRDALEIESKFVQREFPSIAVIWYEALQNAKGARLGANGD